MPISTDPFPTGTAKQAFVFYFCLLSLTDYASNSVTHLMTFRRIPLNDYIEAESLAALDWPAVCTQVSALLVLSAQCAIYPWCILLQRAMGNRFLMHCWCREGAGGSFCLHLAHCAHNSTIVILGGQLPVGSTRAASEHLLQETSDATSFTPGTRTLVMPRRS